MSVKLVFLGTGSGKPTPHRNVSAVGLFREGDLLLFDCGEGTQLQLAKAPLRPGSLRAIFLTHFHGDHVNGLPGFVGSLTLNSRDEVLTIVGPVGLRRWFKTMRDVHILRPGFPINLVEVEGPGVVFEGQGFRVEAGPLKHRIPTWGYTYIEDARPGRFDLDKARELGIPAGPLYGRLQRGEAVILEDGREVHPSDVLGHARPGLRIAYCTDTQPCEGAVELARGADLLIHESTYPAGDEKLAKERGHSTSADAARCAKEAGAKKLVLTHLSQKHMRLDDFLTGARDIFPNIVVARDLLEMDIERSET
ncbi:ribonuclease Z [Microvenator marinus]|jgi:ribonuclease Z|uniref:Ribonuclease Z n=1 Tax=Microvenator marinus TaxID=2600177 RepID=A0A5B8XUE7_9DELT|nr:ribonuclease Z [Microvenator marinus]QED28538.1 ribonuclease Z [Microvenator marinus]